MTSTSNPPRARLYTRGDCALCDRVEPILARLAAEGLVRVERVDISADPALEAAYGARIPVVEIAGRITLEPPLGEFKLRRALEATIDRRGAGE